MKTAKIALGIIVIHFISSVYIYGQTPLKVFNPKLSYTSQFIDERKNKTVPQLGDFEEFIIFKPRGKSDSLFVIGMGKVETSRPAGMQLVFRMFGYSNLPAAVWVYPGNRNSFELLNFEKLVLATNHRGCIFLKTDEEVLSCMAYSAYKLLNPGWDDQSWAEGEISYWYLQKKWFSSDAWKKVKLNTMDGLMR